MTAKAATPPASLLKNVYSCEEFAAEILRGMRTPHWVRQECRAKRIKTVGKHPWIIPQSEARRYIGQS